MIIQFDMASVRSLFFYFVPLDDNNTEQQQQQLPQMKTEPIVAEPSRIIKQKTE